MVWAGALGPAALARRLAAADLCVWPAVNEAFGMALLEAQASGLPVVAGASGGVGEIVAAGASGLLVPPGDATGFAAAVRRLIVDRGLRAALCRGGAAARPGRARSAGRRAPSGGDDRGVAAGTCRLARARLPGARGP